MGVDKSPMDTYPMRLLAVGERVNPVSYDHPVFVLACWLISPSDVDAYAMWDVLCFLPHEPLHPFVVWTAYDRPEGWSFGNGDYCRTLDVAVSKYEGRGGRY